MAAVLALASAIVYGAGDFLGGLASRRLPPMAVVLRTHVVGWCGLVLALPLVGGAAPHAADIWWGVVGGVIGGFGILLLYSAMAAGKMSVAAPLTAVLAAVVPVVVGVGQGERPSLLAAAGVGAGLVAIALVSREHDGEQHVGVETRVLLMAIGSGLCFGLFFVALDATDDDVGLWPIVAGRSASVVMFAVLVAFVASARVGSRAARAENLPWLLVWCGLFDAGANALYLLATQHGLLTLVAVLTSLYPASTVLLARFVLHERLSRWQLGGVGLAAAAVVCVAAG